jgi:enoyl-CoA hydratase/carnithine racemase
MVLTTKTDGASDDYIPTSRLWLTADCDRVVPEGDPDAAFLFAIPGRSVPRAEALRYGLIQDAPAIQVKERVPDNTKEVVPEETKKPKVSKKVKKKPTPRRKRRAN